jgi:hypothetical protein
MEDGGGDAHEGGLHPVRGPLLVLEEDGKATIKKVSTKPPCIQKGAKMAIHEEYITGFYARIVDFMRLV